MEVNSGKIGITVYISVANIVSCIAISMGSPEIL